MTVGGLRKSYHRMTPVAFTHMRCCIATGPPTKIGQNFLQNKKRIRALVHLFCQSRIQRSKEHRNDKGFLTSPNQHPC